MGFRNLQEKLEKVFFHIHWGKNTSQQSLDQTWCLFLKVRYVNDKYAVQKHIIGIFSYLLGQKYIAKKFGSDVVSVFFKVRCVNGKSAVQKHIIGLFQRP